MKIIKRVYINGILREEIKEEEIKKSEKLIGELLNEPKFEDLVYNQTQKEFMQLILNKLKSGDVFHLLFSGFAGTGKTYSSKMFATELEKPFIYLNGQMNQAKIREILLKAKENSLICIDEIHNLPERVAEVIYPAVEYGELSQDGEIVKLNNPLFIGTTTEPQELPKPLLDRFFKIEFEEPNKNTLKAILEKMGLNIEVINIILNYTTNIRVVKKLLKCVDLYGNRNLDNLKKTFQIMEINMETGLNKQQERYIGYLKKVGKASARGISLALGMSEKRVKGELEPELIKKGLINVTSRGRELNTI